MFFSPCGRVLSADRRVDAIEVRCASLTQILALPDNHGTRGRGRVRGRLRLKNENDSWIDEEETSRKWGARWLVSRSSQSFPNRTRPRTRARPRIRIHLGRSENIKGREPSQTGLNLVPFTADPFGHQVPSAINLNMRLSTFNMCLENWS